MIFATGSTYSQGTPALDWMAPVMGVVIGLTIIAGIVAAIFGIKSWPTPSRVWWACEACTPMKSWTPTKS